MTEITIIREDEKATAILKAIRLIDEGAELAPVVHGRWGMPDHEFSDYWSCSACGDEFFFECDPRENNCHYCPSCGAKMDLEDADGQN